MTKCEPFVVNEPMQNAADAAFARLLWWETQKLILDKMSLFPEKDKQIEDAGDYVVKQFIKRCEEGFFDVKRQEK